MDLTETEDIKKRWQEYRSEVKSLSRVRLFATPWTVAYQAPPSMGFSRQEYTELYKMIFMTKIITMV